ncbi:ABC transporter permease [Gemmata sp. G18]|uniref:ABC transporter permease n=1 Tax=Gemmata palustris TaxID=2822762 RepID=A0ABS5BV63_9BACT|nr:ABC transporter permease [Gemmata palustris]MBP3957622.1 ABC transporter permease [Gemmata palustris]
MRATCSLIRREFAAYFTGPIGYVALFGFLVLNGLLFWLVIGLLTEKGPQGVEYPMQVMLGGAENPPGALVAGVLFWGLFPAVTGIITSRLIAEERGSGTLESLLTAPIRDWQVVLAKFVACFAFYLLLWATTLVYVPVLADLRAEWQWNFTLYSVMLLVGVFLLVSAKLGFWFESNGWLVLLFGLLGLGLAGAGGYLHATKDARHLVHVTANIDPMPVLTSYLGVVLAGAMFLALGLLVSSWVKSQLVAWMLSLLLGLGFVLPAALRWQVDSGSQWDALLYYVSVPEHFRRDFTRGVIDTRPLVMYVTATLCCLYLTVRSLEARRLR